MAVEKVLETAEFGDKSVVLREASVLPGNFDGDPHLIPAILLIMAGFFLILILERVAAQKPLPVNATNQDL